MFELLHKALKAGRLLLHWTNSKGMFILFELSQGYT
jgi:hypothetical protein